MAFLKATPTRYENKYLPDGVTMCAIYTAGLIFDDTWVARDSTGAAVLDASGQPIYQPRYSEFWIQGPAFDALPPIDPTMDGQPSDPRYQAIQKLLAQGAVDDHARMVAEDAAKAKVVARSDAEIAAMPVLTPDLLTQMGITGPTGG